MSTPCSKANEEFWLTKRTQRPWLSAQPDTFARPACSFTCQLGGIPPESRMGPPRTTTDMAGHARTPISATAQRRRVLRWLILLGEQFACLNSIRQYGSPRSGQIIENNRNAWALRRAVARAAYGN